MRFRHPASGEVQFPKRKPARGCAWILLLALAGSTGSQAADAPGAAREALRARLIERTDTLHARGEVLTTADTLAEVYRERRYTPLWLDPAAWPHRIRALRNSVRAAAARGLRPIDYHRRALAKLPDAAPVDPAAAADAELLLSDTFLLLARHLERGKLDRVSVEPVWTLPPQDETTRDLLVDAVTGNRIESGLRALGPNHPDYAGLVKALARLREQRAGGGFTLIEPGPTLRPGDVSDRVPALRRRLEEAGIAAGSGDLDSHHYDAALARVVRIAQAREGLDEDGLAGARTLAALNAPVQSRIERVLASLERFRWLPIEPDRPRVIVNIAGFRLRLERQGRTVLEMPVVVGRKERQTPVFSSRMTHVVLHPSWEVPPSIALEKVQSLQRAPEKLAAAGFEVLDSWQPDARRVPLDSIDWQGLSEEHFPYRLRQRPGPANALGEMKFMLPNAWHIYLHDSPERGLFAQNRRDFSAGCVRLSHPRALLYRVFQDSDWSRDELDAAIAGGRERTLMLERPLAVQLQYWTASMDADGRLMFSEDVYDRDEPLLDALRAPPPAAG